MHFYRVLTGMVLFLATGTWAFNKTASQEVRIYSGPDKILEDHSLYAPKARSQSHNEQNYLRPNALCVEAIVASNCCYYTIYDGYAKKNINYKGPKPVFGSEEAARNWAKQQIPRMVFLLPYDGAEVSLGQGWHYNNGGEHSGLDSWRDTVQLGKDVSFDVLAAAPGRVVTKLWDDWFGNTVIIEHTAHDGTKYRTIYMHLRDGFSHDVKSARAMVPPDKNANDNWAKYARYAKYTPLKLFWGQESDTIAVNVGDWVRMGQYIGKSGNTGAGGAGNGLNNDGTPFDKIRANNHLHFMLTVPSPQTPDEWVFIDAFGVYNQVSSGCYASTKEVEYPRFFVPWAFSGNRFGSIWGK
ncbi:M23 family metallopeptidase [Bdellovibrio sp. HCB-162]|uniref:M23 family metallopeptidase n=1 Tax=Bdellovibrio sp. HCB-162 TaxID=3394234 RepID=UPI0039BD32A4